MSLPLYIINHISLLKTSVVSKALINKPKETNYHNSITIPFLKKQKTVELFDVKPIELPINKKLKKKEISKKRKQRKSPSI